MGIIEIIAAIALILACIFIIAVVLMQDSKQGMSNVISGGSNDNYFQRNSGRTKEAKLNRLTKVAAIVLFVITLAVNVIAIYFGGSKTSGSGSSSTTTTTTTSAVTTTAPTESGDSSASTTTTPAGTTESTTTTTTTAA